ncbi:hypothetical protein SEA_LIFES_108 [Microbacterium phage Lifes]|nr:hypothetical protein SEA_LIFES_108 [Microbacterium phage Lifes]
MTNERLIEEAAKAVEKVPYHAWHDVTRAGAREIARATLAVFEKAHTPTDDEREAEVKSYSGWDADEVARYPRVAADVIEQLRTRLLDEFRRAEVPEQSAECPKCGVRVADQTPSTFYTHHDETCGGALEEPQGEPSDAQVTAALHALYAVQHPHSAPGGLSDYGDEVVSAMRAALRAAQEAR